MHWLQNIKSFENTEMARFILFFKLGFYTKPTAGNMLISFAFL